MASNPPTYPPIVLKRIQKDLSSLAKEPVVNAAAAPHNNDLTFWDAIIRIPITDPNQKYLDLHFNILFPTDYPQSAPSIGFTFSFPYSLGASYTKDDGPLKGKLAICLDILGNFNHVHTEWKRSVGSGWSPSYSISSLLINLQTILTELDDSLDQTSRNKLVQQAAKFFKANPEAQLPIPTEETIQLAMLNRKLSTQAQKFAVAIKIDQSIEKIEHLLEFEKGMTRLTTIEDLSITPSMDDNIVCYASGLSYTEDILGYGLTVVRQGRQQNISTPAELLSKSSFDNGVRQSSNKQEFKYFLPAFINKKHSVESSTWKNALRSTLIQISQDVYNIPPNELARGVFEIFSRLINTLVLEMMKQPDMTIQDDQYSYFSDEEDTRTDNQRMQKSPSIAYFEAICSFWRTFYWLSESNLLPGLKQTASMKMTKFAKFENQRLKNICPDIGAQLAAFSVFQTSSVKRDGDPEDKLEGNANNHMAQDKASDGFEVVEKRQRIQPPSSHLESTTQFVDAYLDECFLRCVRWWKNQVLKPDPEQVFAATKTSRDITLFQLMFSTYVIGTDVTKTARHLDETNGKAPQVLEKFQQEWKETQRTVCDWMSFLRRSGCSQRFKDGIAKDEVGWIRKCISRATDRGKMYI